MADRTFLRGLDESCDNGRWNTPDMLNKFLDGDGVDERSMASKDFSKLFQFCMDD